MDNDETLLRMMKSGDKEMAILAIVTLIQSGLSEVIAFIDRNGEQRNIETTVDILSEKIIHVPDREDSNIYIRFLPENENEFHYVFYGTAWISVFKGYDEMSSHKVVDLTKNKEFQK